MTPYCIIQKINTDADPSFVLGAYHSLGTLSSIPSLADHKIHVKSFSFSEPQQGKSSCDRVAAQVIFKKKLNFVKNI